MWSLGLQRCCGWAIVCPSSALLLFHCSHPNAFFQPHLHHGGCSGGGHLGLNCHGCCGACSTHFSSLLQPSVHSVEDLKVMASSHRPLPSHSLCGRVSLPDGDHSVCAPGGASGGLDGLHRSDGSIPQVPVPQLLVTFFASCSMTLSITSKRCALASPRLRRSSPGSWLLFQLYSILWGSV